MSNESKSCKKCGEVKPLTAFSKLKDGTQSKCRDCEKEYYKQNKERIIAKQLAAYHERQEPKQKERIDARQRKIDSETKSCCTCKEEKSKSEFAPSKSAFDGLKRRCKACCNEDNKRYRVDNPETSRASSANWKKANRGRATAQVKRLYWKDPEKYRAMIAKRRAENPEKTKEISKRASTKRRLRPDARIHDAIGNRLRSVVNGTKKRQKSFDLLGYTESELLRHLERQFTKGMTFKNFGEWHIDHIMPLSSFNIKTIDCPDVKAAWALSNLRPIWAKENLMKGKKIIFLL